MDVLAETKTYEWLHGERVAIAPRGLTQETCEKWGYEVSKEQGCHIANYRDAKGNLVAQKIRRAGKQFSIIGSGKNLPLYGQWLWGGGKRLIITEGEIDALSMSQAHKNKWPVVSLPNGAQSAAKALAANYEWLDAFEKIILMFDQDDPGRTAVEEAAAILPVGKVYVAVLPCKDANETLLKHGPGALVSAQWDAKPWRPDGIVSGEDFSLEKLKQSVSVGFEMPYPELQGKTLGLRKGELTLLTAGSGIGKSTMARELAYWLHQHHGLSIGNVFLEEQNVKTAQCYIAIDNNVPVGRLRHNPAMLSDEQWSASLKKVIQQRMWFYDHFGSLDSSRLFTKLMYLAKVCKVDFIMLDHISIVTSGMESSSEGERKDIDILMTKLASFTQETGVGVVAVVHLKRVNGKNFNEGGQVSLNDLRGSASLEQLSDNVWAIERDQQADAETSDMLTVRVLKNREVGDLGETDVLIYNRTTGRLELPVVQQL